jgi:acyl carrier protein
LPTYPFVRKRYRSTPPARNASIQNGRPRFIPFMEEDTAPLPQTPPSRNSDHRSGAPWVESGEIRRTVRRVLSEVLFFDDQDDVNDADNFFELGLNSVSIVTFVQQLNRTLNLNLRETIAFDYANISALSRHIVSEAAQISVR